MATRGIARTTLGEDARHEGFLRHKSFRWAKIALFLCLILIAGYVAIPAQPRPNGGTAFGYATGSLAALLILWLTLIGVRKRAMTRGRWSLKGWTSAHVYLGLSLIVVATLHSGFQFGWNVHTLAWALMLLVIASGLWGIAAYAMLPEKLSNSRAEMTRPQMLDAIAKFDQQLQSAAQPLAQQDAALVLRALADDPFRAGLLRRLSSSPRGCRTDAALRELRRRLGLSTGPEAGALEPVVGLLEGKSAALARIRRYLRVRALLEVWLYVHVPLSFALIAAVGAHIFSVFYYW
jgi:hypothetical protein